MKKRIPSLDGIRAISILLVIVSHTFGSITYYFDLGNFGVRVFFVISSYLIVSLLLRDVQKNRFDLSVFYFKRILRTFPAFYFFLIVLLPTLYFLNLFEWQQFWRAPIYLENFHPRNTWSKLQWFIGHTWSLAVEEQFYLVVALLFFIFNKYSLNRKFLLYTFLGVMVLSVLFRTSYFIPFFIQNLLFDSNHRSLGTVADALAIGGIMAIYLKEIESSKSFKRFKKLFFLTPLIFTVVLFTNSKAFLELFGHVGSFFYNIVGITIINILIGLSITLLIKLQEKTLLYRFLNNKFIVFVGLLSYSLYLWQQPFLYKDFEIPFYISWPIIFGCALISYYFIEEPFLKWRDSYLSKKIEKK